MYSEKSTLSVLLYIFISLFIISKFGMNSDKNEINLIGVILIILFLVTIPLLLYYSKKNKEKKHVSGKFTIRAGNRIIYEQEYYDDGYSYKDLSKIKDDYQWISPGESINIKGYEISGGMFYYGSHMVSSRSKFEMDPCFIKEDLEIDSSNPDYSGIDLDYWPSYNKISPRSRAAFLEWLSKGRDDQKYNIGYVFLYYYGLERRLLYDRGIEKIESQEIHEILNEIKRLLNIYGKISNSFYGYASKLLEYIQIINADKKFYKYDPPEKRIGWDIPTITKLALSQLISDGKTIPAEWAKRYPQNFKK